MRYYSTPPPSLRKGRTVHFGVATGHFENTSFFSFREREPKVADDFCFLKTVLFSKKEAPPRSSKRLHRTRAFRGDDYALLSVGEAMHSCVRSMGFKALSVALIS